MSAQKKTCRTASTLQWIALVIASTGAIAACGGSGAETATVAAGPLTLVVDAKAGFQLPQVGITEQQRHLQIATANANVGQAIAPMAAPFTAQYHNPAALRRQWCFSPENAGPPPELFDTALIPATQVFDNVWGFGLRWVMQYAFRTEDGKLFLIDTLNDTKEVQTITLPSLNSIGLPPSLLIGAMPTHGHSDHLGGASYLQRTFSIPIYLGSGDLSEANDPNSPVSVIPLDSQNLQPQYRTFGGTQFVLLSTPGHTPGTFSGVVPVKHLGRSYRIAFWGGTGMPNSVAGARQYLDAAERFYRLAEEQKIDGTFHTHPFVDNSLEKLDALARTPATTSNPFLVGNSLAMQSLATLRECSAARVSQLDGAATIPAWHATSLQVEKLSLDANGALTHLRATLRSPFGALRNASIKFALSSGASCTAFTDQAGQASCSMDSTGATSVTASFSQAALPEGSVQLSSSSTISIR